MISFIRKLFKKQAPAKELSWNHNFTAQDAGGLYQKVLGEEYSLGAIHAYCSLGLDDLSRFDFYCRFRGVFKSNEEFIKTEFYVVDLPSGGVAVFRKD